VGGNNVGFPFDNASSSNVSASLAGGGAGQHFVTVNYTSFNSTVAKASIILYCHR
jgi:hypothetical protein